jgi:hypothetical protein
VHDHGSHACGGCHTCVSVARHADTLLSEQLYFIPAGAQGMCST